MARPLAESPVVRCLWFLGLAIQGTLHLQRRLSRCCVVVMAGVSCSDLEEEACSVDKFLCWRLSGQLVCVVLELSQSLCVSCRALKNFKRFLKQSGVLCEDLGSVVSLARECQASKEPSLREMR